MRGFVSSFDKDLIERIRMAVDIVDVAQGYFPVTKRGANFLALCPFHREKTPSFNLNPSRQIFHCFGCQKSGDAFTLVMELDRLSFPEAVKVLARRAGIVVQEKTDPRFAVAEERRLKLFTIVKHAEEFFRATLHDAPGAAARDYLSRRGFDPEVIESFGVGFAPNEWRALYDELRRRGHSEQDLMRAGVVKTNEKTNRPFDLLRRRVVIPIRDVRGRTVAFGGRLLDDAPEDSGPKYLNTPETELFSKRQVLFGFDRAREEASRRGEFVLVEGYLDVIAAHQYGARNVVASLGTALTPDHAHLLQRYARRVVLLFDPDEGGQRGADRGAAVLLREGFDVRVATLPDGLDPDEFLARSGLEAFERTLVDRAEDLVGYLVRRAKERAEGGSESAAARSAREILHVLGQMRDPLQSDLLVSRVAHEFGLEEAMVRRIAAEILRAQPAEDPARRDDGPRASARPRFVGVELDEVFVLHGAVTCATLEAAGIARRVVSELTESDFRDPARRRVFHTLSRLVLEGSVPAPSVLSEVLKEDPEALAVLQVVVGAEIAPGDSPERAFARLVGRRKDHEYRKARDEVRRTGILNSDDDVEVERRLLELSTYQAERYQRMKAPRPASAGGDADPRAKPENPAPRGGSKRPESKNPESKGNEPPAAATA